MILANLNDKIVTKTGDQPEKPIAQSLAINKKGILVATIGDLTGLLSGSYEDIYYFINDHLGTPQMMTDSSAIVVWQADYDPFGKATVNDDPDGNGVHITNNIRFPGQYYDTETGLHYNYHRYYDPGIGRYLSPDPIGEEAGINLYTYVMNNPIQLVDPMGLKGFDPGPNPQDPQTSRDPRTPWLPPNLQHRSENCPPYYSVRVSWFIFWGKSGLIPLVGEEQSQLSDCKVKVTCLYSGIIAVGFDWQNHKVAYKSYYKKIELIKTKKDCCEK